jgi:hypothetical protein
MVSVTLDRHGPEQVGQVGHDEPMGLTPAARRSTNSSASDGLARTVRSWSSGDRADGEDRACRALPP